MRKRIWSMLLCALLLVTLLVPAVSAEEPCEHQWSGAFTPATFTDEGSVKYTCSLCGETIEREIPVQIPTAFKLTTAQKDDYSGFYVLAGWDLGTDGTNLYLTDLKLITDNPGSFSKAVSVADHYDDATETISDVPEEFVIRIERLSNGKYYMRAISTGRYLDAAGDIAYDDFDVITETVHPDAWNITGNGEEIQISFPDYYGRPTVIVYDSLYGYFHTCYLSEKVYYEGQYLDITNGDLFWADLFEAVPGFSDVPEGKWYTEGIEFARQLGIMSGMGSNRFAPNATMTRAMLVQVLYALEGSPALTYQPVFTDVPAGKWYSNAILWASENGIVAGMGNGLFAPDATVTREQIAAILCRYANAKGIDVSARAELSDFTDADQVSNYAKEPIQWAVAEGLLYGRANGSTVALCPAAGGTRAEIASIVMRLLLRYPTLLGE